MCALRQARILSSETDNTIKQEQNTNVNIKISKPNQQQIPVNFTQQSLGPLAEQQQPSQQDMQQRNLGPEGQQAGNNLGTQMENSQFQFQPPTNNLIQDRGIADLGVELDTLETKNKFLEMIVQMYESNPLKVNSYVVCERKLLMDMIKLLTECDKVELVIDDSDVGCTSCCGFKSRGCTASAKFMRVAKILIIKDGKTEDMKYAYNDIYSQFIKYGISLKLVI